MRVARTSASTWWFLGTLLLLVASFSAAPPPAMAQCNNLKGFNTVFGGCATNQGTFAMVDASQYSASGDICAAIQAIFNTYNGSQTGELNIGLVVDARGFNAGMTQPCSDNPWNPSIVLPLPPSSIVLLPSGIITIHNTWTLPSYAHVIGQGPNATIIQAAPNFAGDSNNAMIEMGTLVLCTGPPPNNQIDCPGISLEHLGLDGNSVSNINGVFNSFAQELAYVNDVGFTNITKIGLVVTNITAADSGPYTNLTMSNVNTCIDILAGNNPLYTTRGVHGLTCNLSTTSLGPAIYLDAPNNTLEDISINGSSTSTQDGILIGRNGPAEDNVLFNIRGSGLKNLIHITNFASTNPPPNCPTLAGGQKYNVCDVTILGVTNLTANTTTIQDDLINLAHGIPDPNLAMYIVGEPVQAGSSIGYSRFTTSPNSTATAGAVTWLVGSTPLTSQTGPCAVGSLYSCTSNSTTCPTTTVWGCVSSTGGGWKTIK